MSWIRQMLPTPRLEAYGESSYVDENREVFDDGHVMLRKDKPEVLMVSEKLAALYRAQYFGE